jgi:hypothetical protein
MIAIGVFLFDQAPKSRKVVTLPNHFRTLGNHFSSPARAPAERKNAAITVCKSFRGAVRR